MKKSILLFLAMLLCSALVFADILFEDGFESDTGWTLTGEFEIDAPIGLGGEHGNPDPDSAFAGTNVLGTDLTGLGTNPGDYEGNLADTTMYIATSPVVDCSGYIGIQLNFQCHLNVEDSRYDYARIEVSTDGTTWDEVWVNPSGTDMSITDSVWSEWTVNAVQANDQATAQFRFTIGPTDGSWYWSGWNIDEFKVLGSSPTDIPSPSVYISPADSTTDVMELGTLAWDVSPLATGYKLYLGTDGNGTDYPTDVNDGTDLGNVTTYEFSGLAFGTTYYWAIVPFNAGGDAADCPIWSFTTRPDPVISTFPWTETFEHGGEAPPNWINVADESDQDWIFKTPITSDYSQPVDHSFGDDTHYIAFFDDSNSPSGDASLITPPMDITGIASPTLSFFYSIGKETTSVSDTRLVVDVYSEGTWNTELLEVGLAIDWTEGSLDLSDYAADDVMIRFTGIEHATEYDRDIALDDVTVYSATTTPPPCGAGMPDDGAVDIVINNSLAWTSSVGALGYKLFLGTDGGGTTTPTDVIDNLEMGMERTIDLTSYNLAYSTTYYWQVVPYNLNGNAVDCPIWSFTTQNDPSIDVFPFSVDFATDNWPPLGWDLTGGTQSWSLEPTSQTAEASFWGWQDPNDANLITPPISFSGIGTLSFEWSHLYNSTYPDDALEILVSDDMGQTWTQVWYKTGTDLNAPNAQSTTPGDFILEEMELPQFAGHTVLINFHAISDYGPDLFLDNITIDQYTAGQVTGTVALSGGTGIITDVEIRAGEFTTSPDLSGAYTLICEADTTDITASLFGYHSHTITDVVVPADGVITGIDFTLNELTNVTVTGRVVGSDFPDVGLADAEIIVTGYETYMDSTDADGYFTLENVFSNQTYQINVNVGGYSEFIGELVVEFDDVDMGDVIVAEIANPPLAVQAVANLEETEVALTWMAPLEGAAGSFDFEAYDGDFEADGNWGWGIPIDAVGAHSGDNVWGTVLNGNYGVDYARWTLDSPVLPVPPNGALRFWQYFDTEGYCDGGNVKISVDGGDNWTLLENFLVGAYSNTTSGLDGEMSFNGHDNTAWHEVVFDLSEYSSQLVKLRWDFGTDVSVHDYVGWYIDDVELTTNTAIAANDDQSPNLTTLANLRSSDRVFENTYSVYRMPYMDQDTTNWVYIGDVADTNFVDNTFGSADGGMYNYAIRANYTNGVKSRASISNWVARDMYVPATFNLTSDGNQPVMGAEVELISAEPDPDGNIMHLVGTAAMTPSVVFNQVWRGDYELRVFLPGHDPYYDTVSIPDAATFDITLSEIQLPVATVTAELNDTQSEVTLNWPAPNPLDGAELRRDCGIAGGNYNYGGSINSMIGTIYNESCTVRELTWALTSGPDGATVHDSVNLVVLGLKPNGQPDAANILYQAIDVPNIDLEWNSHVLATPVEAPDGFFIGINTPNQNMYIAHDGVTEAAYPYIENAQYYSSDWTGNYFYTGDASYFGGNFLLRAYVVLHADEEPPAEVISLNTNAQRKQSSIVKGEPVYSSRKALTNISSDREVTSYTVYRFAYEDNQNELVWTELASGITDLTYTDTGWSSLTTGNYQYAVKTVYTTGTSNPTLSNWLAVGQYAQVTVNVTDFFNVVLDSAKVTLQCLEVDPDSVYRRYQMYTDDTGTALFSTVWMGNYKITVAKESFATIKIESTPIFENRTFDITLTEKLNPVNRFRGTASVDDVVLTWTEPVDAIEIDFEEDDGEFTVEGGFWAHGTDATVGAHSGDNVWGTALDADYAANNVDASLYSTEIDIASEADLSFWQYVETETNWDGGNVKISIDGGDTWDILTDFVEGEYTGNTQGNGNIMGGDGDDPGQPTFTGHPDPNPGWHRIIFNLEDYEGETAIFRWHFATDNSVNGYMGWYIDDVAVGAIEEERAEMAAVRSNKHKIAMPTLDHNRALQSYALYRDGQNIATVNPDVFEFVDENLADGVYHYEIAAVYDSGTSDSAEVNVPVYPVDVTGFVNASDDPLALVGATVVFQNEDFIFQTITGDGTEQDGNFTITGVNGMTTYQVTITAPGYADYNTEVTLTDQDVHLGILTMLELTTPPSNIQLAENAAQTTVMINWAMARSVTEAANRVRSQKEKRQVVNSIRELESFNIYRFLAQNEDNPGNWLPVAQGVTGNTYSDVQWALVPQGTYKWAIQAIYTGGNTSEFAISDSLVRTPIQAVVINVSTNSGDPAEGTSISLSDGTAPHTYSGVIPAGGSSIALVNVANGTYTLTATKDGFEDFEQTGINVSGSRAINVLLEENKAPVGETIEFTTLDTGVQIDWDAPGTDRNVLRSNNKDKKSLTQQASRSFVGYKIKRDDEVIADSLTTTTYTDTDITPHTAYEYKIYAVYTSGSSPAVTATYNPDATDTQVAGYIPTALGTNYPNPFNPVTTIRYSVEKQGHVLLEVYNVKGQHVKTLVDGAKDRGRHEVTWKGDTQDGKTAVSGIYFYRMKSGRYTTTKKMILLK